MDFGDYDAAPFARGITDLYERHDQNMKDQSRNVLDAMMMQQAMREQAQRAAIQKALGGWREGGDNAAILQQVRQLNPELAMKIQAHDESLRAATAEERLRAEGLARQLLGPIAEERDDGRAGQMWDVAARHYRNVFPRFSGLIPDRFNRQWVDMMYQRLVAGQGGQAGQWGSPIAAQDEMGNEVFVTQNKQTGQVSPVQRVGGGYIRPRAQQPLVNIANQQESEEAKAFGKYLVDKEYGPISERAQVASELLSNLKMGQNIDVATGAFEPAKNAVARYVAGLGLDPTVLGLPNASNAEALTAVMGNAVLQKMLQQRGVQTESDTRRVQETVAGLGNTPKAFRFLMNAATALEERALEQRQFYDRFRAARGTFQGAAQAWDEFKRITPLMVKNPKTGLPTFFSEFREANPDVPEAQLLQAWRAAAKGGQ